MMFGWIKLCICITCQQYQVVATETVNPAALEANIDCAIATEKLDGTCCYVTMFEGNSQINKINIRCFFFNFLSFASLQFPERVCGFSLGRPHLWARLDRKPNKQAEKRFKKYQHSHRSCKGTLLASNSHWKRTNFSLGSIVVFRFHVECRRWLQNSP